MSKKYEWLRNKYPAFVSKDQIHVICKISKRSVTYLLKHGVIPCIDNGKKTHRYQIALDDIITYLKKRDKNGSMIPRGAVSSKHRESRVSYSSVIVPGQEEALKEYFEHIYAEYPDTLSSYDLKDMTGLSRKTTLEYLKSGTIKSLKVEKKYVVPKRYLLEFVTSSQFINMKSNSQDFIRILGGFERWKAAKS